MGRNKQARCEICSKQMRSDNLKRHMRQHAKVSKYPMKVSKYPMKDCSICKKTMISWHLPRHIKTHSMSLQKVIEGMRVDHRTYLEKLQIGRIVKYALDSEDINPNSLNKYYSEALEVYMLRCNAKQERLRHIDEEGEHIAEVDEDAPIKYTEIV